MKKVKKNRAVKIIGMMLVFLTISSSIASAQAAWPWEKPSEPDVPAWEPQREWVAPPDEAPPVLSLAVLSLLSPNGRESESVSPESSYTEDGHLVVAYQFDADKDGWLFRVQLTVREGLSGADEDGYYASGVDVSTAVLHIGSGKYSLTEQDATLDQPNKAVFNRRSIQLTKGMEDVRVWSECADKKGNAASSDRINLRVRSGEEVVRPVNDITGRKWNQTKIDAKNKKGPLRLDTTKGRWLYYARCNAFYDDVVITALASPLHKESTLVPDGDARDVIQYDEYWFGSPGRHIYYFWDVKGIYQGWLASHHDPGTAFGTDGSDEMGGDYGGDFTGLGG